jgi:hypothetical protein
MTRLAWIVMLSIGLGARGAGAADTMVGQWKTVDEKSGAVQSVVDSTTRAENCSARSSA